MINPSDQNGKRHVYIQDGKNIFKLHYEDILYFEGYGKYVKEITSGKTYLVRESLTEFEQKLPVDSFLRVHKTYIVNLNKMTGFSTINVLIRDIEIPIGRIFREKVVSILLSDKK